MKPTGPTNPVTKKLIAELEIVSKKAKAPIWKDIARRLSKSTRRIPSVNVDRLERYCKEKETVIIPGKLLSRGNITKPLTVAAFKFSAAGKKKVENAGGRAITIQELIKKSPKGSNIRIIG